MFQFIEINMKMYLISDLVLAEHIEQEPGVIYILKMTNGEVFLNRPTLNTNVHPPEFFSTKTYPRWGRL